MTLDERVQVELAGSRVRRVVIPSSWREHGDVADLARAISTAILRALPSDSPAGTPSSTNARPGLSVRELRASMEMHKQWRAKLTDLRRRSKGGNAAAPAEIVDQRQRVSVSFVGQRFDALHLNPQWAESASLQSLSDTVVDALFDIDLVREPPLAAERAEVRELDAEIRRFVS